MVSFWNTSTCTSISTKEGGFFLRKSWFEMFTIFVTKTCVVITLNIIMKIRKYNTKYIQGFQLEYK